MNAQLVGNMPYLATLPSCVLYLRGQGANGNTTFFDWSPKKRTVTNNSNNVINSTAQSKYPPCSQYYAGNSSTYLSVPGSADFVLGANWIAMGWVYNAGIYPTFGQCYLNSTNWFSLGQVANQFGFVTLVSGEEQCGWYTVATPPSSGWHQYVFGQTGSSSAFLYIDGSVKSLTLDSSGTMGNSTLNSTPFTTGQYSYSNPSPAHPTQYIDEFAIWSANQGSAIPTAAMLNALSTRRLIV